jgi:hypothetical protein
MGASQPAESGGEELRREISEGIEDWPEIASEDAARLFPTQNERFFHKSRESETNPFGYKGTYNFALSLRFSNA